MEPVIILFQIFTQTFHEPRKTEKSKEQMRTVFTELMVSVLITYTVHTRNQCHSKFYYDQSSTNKIRCMTCESFVIFF